MHRVAHGIGRRGRLSMAVATEKYWDLELKKKYPILQK